MNRDENCTNSTTEQDKSNITDPELEKGKDVDDTNNNNSNSNLDTENLDNDPVKVVEDEGCNNNIMENICFQEDEIEDKVVVHRRLVSPHL
jgi:hypothetical protein